MIRACLLGATAIVSLSGMAVASPMNGWYVGLEAGANWRGEVDQHQVAFTGAEVNHWFDFDTGWGLLGTIGYAFDNWRFEVEAGYRENDIDHFQGTLGTNFFPIEAGSTEFTLMANVAYDFAIADRWSLSVGAGAGMDCINTTSQTNGFDDTACAFAYQGIAGVNYALSDRAVVFVNYRYLVVDDVDFTDPSSFAGTLYQSSLDAQTVTLGVRFSLGD
jgi:OmpA-OmpF porin, OOP family